MTTKHQPATPLPFKVFSQGTGPRLYLDVIGGNGKAVLGAGFPVDKLRQNAAYIAHAANAYPKLVEALQGIALRGDDGHYCFDQCKKHELQGHSPFCERYRSILRDLGEKW
jgi:hypothetical protein